MSTHPTASPSSDGLAPHLHRIDGTDVWCALLTHCPSLCDCAVGQCTATVRMGVTPGNRATPLVTENDAEWYAVAHVRGIPHNNATCLMCKTEWYWINQTLDADERNKS